MRFLKIIELTKAAMIFSRAKLCQISLSLCCIALGWTQSGHAQEAASKPQSVATGEKEYQGVPDDVLFFRAVKINNHQAIDELLKRGFDPNLLEPERGDSGLMLAIREDSYRVVKRLLEHPKINLEVKAKNGDTALMLASYKGAVELVKSLLARGAEPNRPGWTALHYAAFVGNNEVVQVLLDAAAYIDAEAPNKNTPIMMAAYGGHVFTVKLLLDEGADATLKNDRGLTALDLAATANHKDIVEGLTYQLKKRGLEVKPPVKYEFEPPAKRKFDHD